MCVGRFEFTRHPDGGSPVRAPSRAARPGQDRAADQDGRARGEADGRIQREDSARRLPRRLPDGQGGDQGGGGENGILSCQLI